MLTKQERKTKTDSGVRTIIIPDLVYEEILRLRKQYERNRNRRKREFRDLDYIVCSTYGMPRGRQSHTKYYKELLNKSSLPVIRWHDLRHTNCTFLIKHDSNPKAVSKGMGHKHVWITLDTYTDKDEIILDETNALESFIAQVIPEKIEVTDNSDYEIDVSEYV
jgi:integrase